MKGCSLSAHHTVQINGSTARVSALLADSFVGWLAMGHRLFPDDEDLVVAHEPSAAKDMPEGSEIRPNRRNDDVGRSDDSAVRVAEQFNWMIGRVPLPKLASNDPS